MSEMSQSRFERYVGIDYSGAEVPTASLPGLKVYCATRVSPPAEVAPPQSAQKHWTRRGIAQWLVQQLSKGPATLVGIDHGFSFPRQYFEKYSLPPDWSLFLDDFQKHWPTDEDNTYVDFVRDGVAGNGAARMGYRKWRRLTEVRAGSAKSVFQFDAPGSVAKPTHAGLPWLRYLRQQLNNRAHFWPFDGWKPPDGKSVVAEVYPALWSRGFARDSRTPSQHDAWCIAEWMRRADCDAGLAAFFNPSLTSVERTVAQIEGWMLGIG